MRRESEGVKVRSKMKKVVRTCPEKWEKRGESPSTTYFCRILPAFHGVFEGLSTMIY